jgi:ribosomal subunit interface protein
MKTLVEVRGAKDKELVGLLIDDLLARLEERLKHYETDSVSTHVFFEENGDHSLSRTSISCHVPGHIIAAHQESKDPYFTIRKAFDEIERQLGKKSALMRKEHLRGRRKSPAIRKINMDELES